MLVVKILQKIFIYTIVLIGTIILVAIIVGSAFLFFKNELIVHNANSLNNDFQNLLINVETNINQTITQIMNLVGTNGTEGEIQKNIASIITELQNFQQTHPGVDLNSQIQQLQNFKDNIIGGNLSNLVSSVQTAANSALGQIKNINGSFINPIVNWFSTNSKKVSLIVFIVSSSILGLTIILTIIVKIFKKKAKKME